MPTKLTKFIDELEVDVKNLQEPQKGWFKNPLDTDVDRPNVKIGTLIPSKEGLEKVYAGPEYGDVTQEKYNELLKSGALGRGQQAVSLAGKQIVQHGKDIYNKVGEVIPDWELPEVSPGVGNVVNRVGQVGLKAWEISGLQRQLNQAINILDAPVKGIAWASRKVDPTGRGIGEAPLRVAETALPFVGGAKNIAKKGIKKGLQYTDEALDAININKQLQPAYAGATNQVDDVIRVADDLPSTAKPLQAISKEGKASQTFKDLDKAARNYAEPRIAAGEKYPLAGFNKKFVDPKDGQIYTVGTYTSSKTGVTKYVYKNKEGKAIATLNRNAARKLDEDTLRFQFSRYQSKYPNVDLVESYRKTNRKVYTAIEKELQELNAEGIAKFGRKNWKELQVEHIHDVQHFAKLSKEAPKFKNKGADELWNITVIPSDVNARTGAQAMSVNPGDALIKATQNDTFIPYEQVTREFIDFGLAEKVENMTKADFTALTQMILQNPNENVHQLLVNYVLNSTN